MALPGWAVTSAMKSNLKLLLTGIVHPTLRLYREEFRRAPTKPALTFAQFRILNGIRRGRNQIGKLALFVKRNKVRIILGVYPIGLIQPDRLAQIRLRVGVRETDEAFALRAAVQRQARLLVADVRRELR